MEKNKRPSLQLLPNPQIEIKIGMKNSISDSGFFLPFDILLCILSSLPAKSVARLRCVCKRWNSLTHDPKFLTLHGENGSARRFFQRCPFTGRIVLYDFDLERPEIMPQPQEIRAKPKDFNLACTLFSNSIRGLTCAYFHLPHDHLDIYILNPTTGEHLRLPTPPTGRCADRQSIGLGFDDSTGEFKVVRLTYERFRASVPIHCQILTVGTGEWRCLADIPCSHYSCPAVFLNGSLHWVVVEHADHMIGHSILTLDIKEETYGPMIPVTDARCSMNLAESGGHLCVLFETGDGWFEVWKLKDYTSLKWNKEYRFHLPDVPENTCSKYPLFLENDKILLQFQEWLTITQYMHCHDHRGNTSYKLLSGEINWLGVHWDSLISPIKPTTSRVHPQKDVAEP